MKLIDVLSMCGNYNNYVQIYDGVTNKKTGIMKSGNVPFRYLDKFSRRKVLSIIPGVVGNISFLYIHLVEGENDI